MLTPSSLSVKFDEVETATVSICVMRTLNHREVKYFVEGPSDNEY